VIVTNNRNDFMLLTARFRASGRDYSSVIITTNLDTRDFAEIARALAYRHSLYPEPFVPLLVDYPQYAPRDWSPPTPDAQRPPCSPTAPAATARPISPSSPPCSAASPSSASCYTSTPAAPPWWPPPRPARCSASGCWPASNTTAPPARSPSVGCGRWRTTPRT